MKVLLFTIEYPPFKGGVAKYYETLVNFWPAKNKIFVLHNNDNKLIKNYSLPKWLPAIFHLIKEIRKNQIDHVLVGHILPLGTATFIVSRIFKLNYSVIIHGMDLEYAQKTRVKKILANIILSHAQKIICNSGNTKKIVEKFFEKNDKKIHVAYPGISPYQASNNKALLTLREKYETKNKFVLLTLSRLVKRKGQDFVIDAINSSKELKDNVLYFIVGKGPDEEYLKSKAKNNKNIIFLGLVDDEEKSALMNLCDVFIVPAREISGDVEGFGIVYLEAALSRKAVIAGKSGGVAEAVLDNVTGLLCTPESITEISEAIIKLKNDEPLRTRLAQNGYERAMVNFSPEKQSKTIYSIIN